MALAILTKAPTAKELVALLNTPLDEAPAVREVAAAARAAEEKYAGLLERFRRPHALTGMYQDTPHDKRALLDAIANAPSDRDLAMAEHERDAQAELHKAAREAERVRREHLFNEYRRVEVPKVLAAVQAALESAASLRGVEDAFRSSVGGSYMESLALTHLVGYVELVRQKAREEYRIAV